MQERDKREIFPSCVMKCHLLHVGIVSNARCEHMWKAQYSSECVIWMTACKVLALVSHPARKYPESAVGPFYPEYLPTDDCKPQWVLEITGELGWALLLCGVLGGLAPQARLVHSRLVLPHSALTACDTAWPFDDIGGAQTCLAQFRHFWRQGNGRSRNYCVTGLIITLFRSHSSRTSSQIMDVIWETRVIRWVLVSMYQVLWASERSFMLESGKGTALLQGLLKNKHLPPKCPQTKKICLHPQICEMEYCVKEILLFLRQWVPLLLGAKWPAQPNTWNP